MAKFLWETVHVVEVPDEAKELTSQLWWQRYPTITCSESQHLFELQPLLLSNNVSGMLAGTISQLVIHPGVC